MAAVKVTGTLGAATSKRFFLPGEFFAAHARHPFVSEEKRSVPVDVHYPEMEQDQVVYQLSDGYSIESVPKTVNEQMPQAAVFKVSASAAADSVTVLRTLAWNFSVLDSKDYGTLHDFYQKVAQGDGQQIVLSKAAATTGSGQ